MASHTSFRLMRTLGTFGCLLAFHWGCDTKVSHRPPPSGSVTSPGSEAVAQSSPSTQPVKGEITLSFPMGTAGEGGYKAFLPDQDGWRYDWRILGGEILQGAGTSGIEYRVNYGVTTVRLTCLLQGPMGEQATLTAMQPVVPAPVLIDFMAERGTVTKGNSLALRWKAAHASNLTLDPGEMDVSGRSEIALEPLADTTYRLFARNEAGTSVSRTLHIRVIEAPNIQSLNVEGSLKPGDVVTLRASFENGKAVLLDGTTVLGSSDQSPLLMPVTLKEGLSVTLKVTNEAGASVTQTWSFQKAPK